MQTALAHDLTHANTAPDHSVKPGRLNAVLQQVVARMIGYCEQATGQEPFQARGLVINTLEDIQSQLEAYFPASTHIAPLMDDLAAEVALTAKKTSQPYVALTFSYVDNGVIPPLADGQDPKTIHIKFYSTDMQMGPQYGGRSSRLQPGWSSSSSQPTDMRKQLNLGAKKGFLLEVSAVDIKNIRAQALDSTLGMIAALGVSPDAMAVTRAALFDGSIDTPAVKDVVSEVLDIKVMQAKLDLQQPVLDALSPLAPVERQTQAELATMNLAVALATKVEALVAALPAMQLPAPLQATIEQAVQPIRVNMEATQLARAVEALSISMPTRLLEAAANDHSAVGESRLAVAKAVENIKDIADTQNISVREAISLSLQGEAPTPVLLATQAVTSLLSDQTVVQHIEQALPLRTLEITRQALESHPVEAIVTTPIGLDTLRTSLAEVTAQTPIPSLGHALAHLDKAMEIDLTALPPGLQQNMMATRQHDLIEQVSTNLNAMAISNSIAPETRDEIKIVAAQLQTAVEQPEYIAATPAPIQTAQQAPIIIESTSAIQQIAERIDTITAFQVQPLQYDVPSVPTAPDATAMQKILVINEAAAGQVQQTSVPDTTLQAATQTQQTSVPDTTQQAATQTQQTSVPDTTQQAATQTQQTSVPDTTLQAATQTQQTYVPDTTLQARDRFYNQEDEFKPSHDETERRRLEALEAKRHEEKAHICGPDCEEHGFKNMKGQADVRTASSRNLSEALGLSEPEALKKEDIKFDKPVTRNPRNTCCGNAFDGCSADSPSCPLNNMAHKVRSAMGSPLASTSTARPG